MESGSHITIWDHTSTEVWNSLHNHHTLKDGVNIARQDYSKFSSLRSTALAEECSANKKSHHYCFQNGFLLIWKNATKILSKMLSKTCFSVLQDKKDRKVVIVMGRREFINPSSSTNNHTYCLSSWTEHWWTGSCIPRLNGKQINLLLIQRWYQQTMWERSF